MTKLNRRHFLIASGLGLNVWVPLPGLNKGYSSTDSKKRRHLINIQGFGGWDSTWHHSPMLEKETAGMTDEQKKNSFYGVYNEPRFPDDVAISFNGSHVGIGWSAFTAQDAKDILIWRGINPAASHDIGNRYTQCGSLSGYAASYSVLIAKALAQAPDYLRPLHYVQTSNTPVDFRSQVGFVTGPGVPINIATYNDWVKLSASDANDPVAPAGLNELYDNLFKSFLEPSAKMKPAAARKFKDEFKPSYEAAEKTRNKNFATDPAYKFKEILDSYKNAIVADVSKVLFNSPGSAFAKNGLKDLKVAVPSTETGVSSFLDSMFGTQIVNNILYPLAVAEFLVTQDLSAVVDCTIKLGDRHNGNNLDFLETMVAAAAFRKLMGTLRKTLSAEGSSQSLLDVTTIVMSTDFDRTVDRYPQDPAGSPGTNHGSTVSLVLAGYGVKGGTIVGARGSGPNGTYAGLGDYNSFNAPLPIDLQTGQPSASGVVVDNGAVQPTILKIFGLTQPTQQFIGAPIVQAVIKS